MKLALGTVQFGLAYGLANAGQVPEDEAARILGSARAAGIDTLDTATAYGEAERVLGRIGTDGWRIVTKVPALPAGTEDPRAWARSVVSQSLENLKKTQFDSVLLHRADDLFGPGGVALWAGLRDAKDAGLCMRIGVSIYSPEVLNTLPTDIHLDLVQAPFNVFDRRLEVSGWAETLAEAGTAIHLRSAFLQGLLLMPPEIRANRFRGAFPQLLLWDSHLAATGQDALSTALGYALDRPWAERVVVGVDSAAQLAGILDAARRPHAIPPNALASDDPDLIDPSRWSAA